MAPAGVTFPDVPRSELDVLLGQVVERAQEVMGIQGRLRGLLRATQLIGADLGLPVVLRRVVEAATALVGSRYAALGVIGADGHLAEFIHTGMDTEAVAAMGPLPQGKGLLGALIDDVTPIRLPGIGADDRAAGFPPGHPPMESFLGVPIRVRDEVYGNLYLTESIRGAFTEEDEEIAEALAAAAGAAIHNARLYDIAQARHLWLEASAAITHRLLTPLVGDPADGGEAAGGAGWDPLRFIARRSHAILDADMVTIIQPDTGRAMAGAAGDPDLRVAVAVGADEAALLGQHVAAEATLSGHVFSTGTPMRVNSARDAGLESILSERFDVGAVMVVPLTGSHGVNGVLTAARVTRRAAFTVDDLDMAARFAHQASVAMELSDARADHARLVMADERERIAADLHDHVIQRLFATGLSLQSLSAALGPNVTLIGRAGRAGDTAVSRIAGSIRELDDTISQIRTTIFGLHVSPLSRGTVRARLMQVVTDITPGLGATPGLRFAGLLDGLADDVAEDLVAVLRESLSNVARHAGAHSTQVEITADSTSLTLTVTDDGVGVPETGRRSGLANMCHRAERLGGSLTITPGRPSGTGLVWTVRI